MLISGKPPLILSTADDFRDPVWLVLSAKGALVIVITTLNKVFG
ncbi:MAG: hypothetical protein AB2374_19325 [Cytobacillus gottheilii]